MALKQDQIRDFYLLVSAARSGKLVLCETKDKNGEQAAFIGAVIPGEEPGQEDLLPLGRAFSIDFGTELVPPVETDESVVIEATDNIGSVMTPVTVEAVTDEAKRAAADAYEAARQRIDQGTTGGADVQGSALIDATQN